MKKNRRHLIQLVIDTVLITLGCLIYMFPHISSVNASMVFYTLMSIYAGLELVEYVVDRESMESLYLFFAAGVCAFSGFFLRDYDTSMVLSMTLAVWTLMIAIIKIISLEKIYVKKANLFTIKLGSLSAVLLMGVLVSINIFYKLSTIGYMMALLYVVYGFLELICDALDLLSDDVKFLKE